MPEQAQFGVIYEFPEPGLVIEENNIGEIQGEYQMKKKRLREVVGDLPPAVPAGSSDLEDNAYCVIRPFEVEKMTYKFSCCEVCKE